MEPVLLVFWTFAAAILFASGWLRARESEIPAPAPTVPSPSHAPLDRPRADTPDN